MILMKDIKKNFNNFSLNINFSINEGEILGIIGESGSGKSTILKILQNLVIPDQGEVIFNEKINSSYIFQDFNLLYNKNVFDNVVLPLILKKEKNREKIEGKVNENLEVVNLLNKKYSNIASLSGGQKQRVAIARSLITKPNLLLCDEITSSLDQNTKNEILELLLKINETYKTTIIFVSHELDSIKKLCNRVLVIENGNITDNFDITRENNFSNNKKYSDYIKEVLKWLTQNWF